MAFNSPSPTPPTNPDWTTGPAKFILVAVLGLVCGTGLAWSILRDSVPASSRDSSRASSPTSHHQINSTLPPATTATGASANSPATPQYEEFPDANAAPTTNPAAAATPSSTSLLNLNTATQAEIELLPGIGPALASRIIEHRTSRGSFKSITDLDAVSGIGPKMIEKIKPLVRFE